MRIKVKPGSWLSLLLIAPSSICLLAFFYIIGVAIHDYGRISSGLIVPMIIKYVAITYMPTTTRAILIFPLGFSWEALNAFDSSEPDFFEWRLFALGLGVAVAVFMGDLLDTFIPSYFEKAQVHMLLWGLPAMVFYPIYLELREVIALAFKLAPKQTISADEKTETGLIQTTAIDQ